MRHETSHSRMKCISTKGIDSKYYYSKRVFWSCYCKSWAHQKGTCIRYTNKVRIAAINNLRVNTTFAQRLHCKIKTISRATTLNAHLSLHPKCWSYFESSKSSSPHMHALHIKFILIYHPELKLGTRQGKTGYTAVHSISMFPLYYKKKNIKNVTRCRDSRSAKSIETR